MIEHLDTSPPPSERHGDFGEHSGFGTHSRFGTHRGFGDRGGEGEQEPTGRRRPTSTAWSEFAARLTGIWGPAAPIRCRHHDQDRRDEDRWPARFRPVLAAAGIWSLGLAVVAVTALQWRRLTPTITEPSWPGTVPAPLLAVVVVGLVVVIGLAVTAVGSRFLPHPVDRHPIISFLVSTAIVAAPVLVWWWLLWSTTVEVLPLGPWLARLVLGGGPLLVLGSVMALHGTVAVVLAAAHLAGVTAQTASDPPTMRARSWTILPSPVEMFLVAGAASLGVLDGWAAGLAILALAGITIRAALVRRWRLTVLAGVTGLVLIGQLTGLVGEPATRMIGYGIATGLVLVVATVAALRSRPTRNGVLVTAGLLGLVLLGWVSDAVTIPWPVRLADLLGVPIPWSGVPIAGGLLWWGLLALARPRTGPRTALLLMGGIQLGLIAITVCGMTGGAPGSDLWPYHQAAGAVTIGLVAALGLAAVRPGTVGTTAPATKAEPQDPPIRDRRSPMLFVTVALLVLALAALTAPLPRFHPSSAAMKFLPVDGVGAAAIWRTGDRSAQGQIEHSRFEDPAAADERFAIADAGSGTWWEEHLTVSGPTRSMWMDVDTGQVEPPLTAIGRTRLLRVGDGGIELRGITNLLGGTLTLGPGAVLLPPDPGDGSRWSGQGEASLTRADGRSVVLEFEVSGFIVRGGNASPAWSGVSRSCQVAAVALDLRPRDGAGVGLATIVDQSWWCPGRGVVLQHGQVNRADFTMAQLAELPLGQWAGSDGGTLSDFGGFAPQDLRRTRSVCPSGVDLAGISGLTGADLELLEGGRILTSAPGRPEMTLTELGLVRWTSRRPNRCTPGTALHHHPGGSILGVSSLGPVVVVTNSTGTATGYAAEGGRLWQVRLSSVARTDPVRVGRSAAVLGTDDRVTFIDLTTGEVRAEVHLPGARTISGPSDDDLVTARVAVADRTGRVTVLSSEGTITNRLRTPAGLRHRVVGSDDRRLVSWREDRILVHDRSGSLSWQQNRPIDELTVLEDPDHGTILILSERAGLTALAADSGRTLWTRGPTHQVVPITAGALLVDRTGVQAVTALGDVVATLPLPAGVTTDRITVAVAGRIVWLWWTDAEGGTRITGHRPW